MSHKANDSEDYETSVERCQAITECDEHGIAVIKTICIEMRLEFSSQAGNKSDHMANIGILGS